MFLIIMKKFIKLLIELNLFKYIKNISIILELSINFSSKDHASKEHINTQNCFDQFLNNNCKMIFIPGLYNLFFFLARNTFKEKIFLFEKFLASSFSQIINSIKINSQCNIKLNENIFTIYFLLIDFLNLFAKNIEKNKLVKYLIYYY